ncbi:hypothetical protein [Bacillus sp. EAC]|uniref:hypothetical protein n=1 Tax=Bacillus sp. EAC TaxID=1978338 RepID=UPI000B448790|nr:hypothetical protein [Bacillus sp. EAC]
MTIDWSPLEPFVNYLVGKLVFLMIIMTVFAIFTNFICRVIKLPKNFTSSVVGLSALFGAYLWAKWFLN